MLKEKKVKEILEGGKLSIDDIDRDADLMWAIADLINSEKHLNMSLNNLALKLKENPNDEKTKMLFKAISYLLNEIRKYRAMNLKHIEKLKGFSLWCLYKHMLGAMMQFGEVAAKEISMGNLDRARECFETSEFCYEAIIFLNKLAEKIYKGGGGDGVQNIDEKQQSIQVQKGRKGWDNIHSMQPGRKKRKRKNKHR